MIDVCLTIILIAVLIPMTIVVGTILFDYFQGD